MSAVLHNAILCLCNVLASASSEKNSLKLEEPEMSWYRLGDYHTPYDPRALRKDNLDWPSSGWRQGTCVGLYGFITCDAPWQWCGWLCLPNDSELVTARLETGRFDPQNQEQVKGGVSKLHFLFEGLTFLPPNTFLTPNNNSKCKPRVEARGNVSWP